MKQQCQNPGVWKFTWPGRDEASICYYCAVKLRQVANAMGLYIQIRPVPEDEQWQCEQIVDAQEGGGE